MIKLNIFKIKEYQETIEKQKRTIEALAKSVAEGLVECDCLREKIITLETGQG